MRPPVPPSSHGGEGALGGLGALRVGGAGVRHGVDEVEMVVGVDGRVGHADGRHQVGDGMVLPEQTIQKKSCLRINELGCREQNSH